MNHKKIIWTLILWFSTITPVHADDFFKVKQQITRDAWLKLFSLYISPALSLTNIGYNSNIYSYEGIEEPDYTADAGINLGIAAVLKDRFIFIINEFPYYSLYLKNKNEEAFNNKFQFAVYTHVGRFNLNYKINQNYTRERPNTEFGARTRQRERNQEVSIDYGRHDRFYINLYAARNQKEYADEQYLQNYDLSRLDREETTLGISLNKRIFSRTQLSLRFEYYDTHFFKASEKDGIGGKLSLGIDFPEISSITGSLGFGWNSFLPKNPGYSDYLKPFGSGGLKIRMFRRLKFHFTYLVGTFFSFWRENQYFDERSGAAGVEYYLSGGLKIGYDYRAGNIYYKTLTDSNQTRADNFSASNISVGVRIYKKMGIAVNYTIYRLNSTQLDFTRRYNFIGGSIIHEF
ncbi:MAG: hypothetical protein MUF15_20830 [Acidobacteria bacterium]|jgi:hypothetical protein|nr:hypothetical protein [Acidobacteriota bacterium]